MENNSNYIFDKIDSFDSLEQEKLFLLQKYSLQIDGSDLNSHDLISEYIIEEDLNLDKSDTEPGKNNLKYVNILDICSQKTDTTEVKIIFNKYLFDIEGEKEGEKEKPGKLNRSQQKEKLLQKYKLSQSVFLKDLEDYRIILTKLSELNLTTDNIDGVHIKFNKIKKSFRKKVYGAIKNKKIEEKIGKPDSDLELDDSDYDFFGINKSNFDEFLGSEQLNQLADKYIFFKLVQKSVEKGYIYTYKELLLIKDIVSDLQNGKVVLMTGDTGSGKTELARFICKEYLLKKPVFVSGDKDKEVSDFTLDTVITSRSMFDDGKDKLTSEDSTNKEYIKEKNFKEIFSQIMQKEEFSNYVKEKNPDEYLDIKKEIDSISIGENSLFTEYHRMGLFKAAELGCPIIIDEVNLIRPEIFMALNDYLTRRVGDVIQLPNGLGEINVKEGFCIILTGNDPEQNSNSTSYSRRYNFDEATYNRLRVYGKNYANQINAEYQENRGNIDDIDYIDYMNENEMYGLILMMMFKKDKNNNPQNSIGKYGFEVMKRDFDWKNINKEDFFNSMKSFAVSISMIQKAFSGENIQLTLRTDVSPKDLINRKVFSMRNLLEIFETYKNDILPIEYHIYNNFIKHTTNKKEKYGLLLIFAQNGFFGDLITDNENASIDNVEKKMLLIRKKPTITLDDINNKIRITKQDLYKEYFGSFSMNDNFFEDQEFEEEKNEEDKNEEDKIGEEFESYNFTTENLGDSIDYIFTKIENYSNIFESENYLLFLKALKMLKDHLIGDVNLEQIQKNKIGNSIQKIIGVFNELDTDSSYDKNKIISLLNSSMSNILNIIGK